MSLVAYSPSGRKDLETKQQVCHVFSVFIFHYLEGDLSSYGNEGEKRPSVASDVGRGCGETYSLMPEVLPQCGLS